MATTLNIRNYRVRNLSLGRRQITAEYESPADTTDADALALVGTTFPPSSNTPIFTSTSYTGVMGPRCVETLVDKDHYAAGKDRILAHYVSRDWQDYLYNTPNKFLMFIDPASTSQSSIRDLDGRILSGDDTLNGTEGDEPTYFWEHDSGEDVNLLPKKRITLWGFVQGGAPYSALCAAFDGKEGTVNSDATMGTVTSATGKLLYQGYSDRRVFAATELHEIRHEFILSATAWNSQHKIQRYSFKNRQFPLYDLSGSAVDGFRALKVKTPTGSTQNTDWFYARHCATTDFSNLNGSLISWPTT